MKEHNTMTGMAAKSPGCLVVLLDYSQGLAESWVGEPFSKAEGVVAELNRWCVGLAQLGDFGVAILGYQDCGDGADIRSLISPHPGLTPAGNLSMALPVAALTPAGSAAQCAALRHCAELLEEWRSNVPSLPAAPVVLHIMTGPPSDGSPRDALRRIDQLSPCDGQPTVINVHLSDGLGDPEFLPDAEPSGQMGRYLYRLSSPLVPEIRASAARLGRPVHDRCRGLVVGASAAELRTILDCVANYVSHWAAMETRILWRFPPDDQPLSLPDGPCHLLACPDGQSFVAFGNRLYALTSDGQLVWAAGLSDVVLGGIAQGPDGALRVHTRDGLVSCIGAGGQTQWRQSVGPPVGRVAPIIDSFGNTLVLTHRGGLAAITPAGQLCSGYRSPAIRCQAPGIVHGEILYLGGLEQQVYALKLAEDGAENLWESISSGKGRCGGPVTSLVWEPSSSTLIVAAGNDCLYAFDPDGEPVWAQNADGRVLSPLCTTSANTVVFATCRWDNCDPCYQLQAMDCQTGMPAASRSLPSPVVAAPAANETGWIFVGDSAGGVYAFDSHWREVWTKQISAPVEYVAAPNNELALISSRGFLAACRSKR